MRRSVAQAVMLLFSSAFCLSAAESQTPDAVLAKHCQAVGGKERLEKLKSQLLKVQAQEGEQPFSAQISFKDGKKLLLNASAANGFSIRQGYDGQGHWWRQDPQGVRQFSGPEQSRDFWEMSLALSARAVLDLKQAFPELTMGSPQKAGEHDCQVIEAKNNEGVSLELWFNAKSGLLVKAGSTILEEYRAEEGVIVPHVVRNGAGMLLKVQSVTFNCPMDDKQFEVPSGAAAGESPAQEGGDYATKLNDGTQTGVVRKPAPAAFTKGPLLSVPAYQAGRRDPFQVDLRSADVSGVALEGRLADLLHADFDSKTVWPAKLPAEFQPKEILERAKSPGLRVRSLHQKGITGKGVGLAIIDQTLLVNHVEYKDQLRSYEEIHSPAGAPAQMHGPAVASLAVGKTVGVAPGADLYYIAEMHGLVKEGKFDWDFTWLAKSIERILELNSSLPSERKIRVISVSVGWSPQQKGCAEADAAVEKAKAAGVFVISTAIERTHKLAFHGLGRDPLKDPEQVDSYGLGSWWGDSFLSGRMRFEPGRRLLVPMDARTTASPTGDEDYVYYSSGGWSWSVPYLAGLYALACQVAPAVTPETFWTTALKTGKAVPVQHEGKTYQLGTIVDPVALVETLQGGK